ncbi:MAG: MBL fold metallo-hydrolase [Actinobacteria bacterium]|nr:MBL fold metallo-hydrolase [Actinomycetota bacterium]
MAKTSPFNPARVRMRARELAPGVQGVFADDVEEKDHTATNAGFVIGESGVLVVESLSNGRLASQLIGEIRKNTALPIRYLVNTSYHGDHCFGNFVFPQETTIIEHEFTKGFIDENFEEDRNFMIELLGEGRGVEEVVPRSANLTLTEGITLDLGTRKAEILHIGFAQTEGDLIVRLPEENIVFAGNMLQAPSPAFPWLLDGRPREAVETYHLLHDMLDDETIIVPGHGRPMCRSDIRYSIEYIEDLVGQIEGTLGQGLTLEQAQEEIRMERYSGYSMYEFIHFQVNIPAVYNEVS